MLGVLLKSNLVALITLNFQKKQKNILKHYSFVSSVFYVKNRLVFLLYMLIEINVKKVHNYNVVNARIKLTVFVVC